jgi:hypothetical protein
MKKLSIKRSLSILVAALSCAVALSGCDLLDDVFGKTDLPDLGIDWAKIQANVTDEKLAEFGWYVDDLEEEIEEFGTVSFYNYDPKKLNAFKEVEYQFYVEYGVGYELVDEEVVYYDIPVYGIMLVDNSSKDYYACTYNDYSAKATSPFDLMSEEGVWFLEEDKAENIQTALKNCRYFVIGRNDTRLD